MSYSIIKPLLFSLDPETAHHLTLTGASLYNPRPYAYSAKLASQVKSLKAPSPIGLAAGLDKNAQALNFFSSLGFGLLEAGTVTMRAQDGNPRPRLWRYPTEESLRNAMGFPNDGSEVVNLNLKNYKSSSLLGINIGKNKDSNAQESISELVAMVRSLNETNYFTINVSSPNTPGLRALQEPGYLTELFSELKKNTPKPLFLKIAPDLERQKVEELATLASDLALEGIIATNTTIMPERGSGGISGALLKSKAQSIHQILLSMETDLNIIGVGGFASFEDILTFWYHGGAWIQLYTALIYQGPCLIDKLNKQIMKFIAFHNLADLGTFFNLPRDVRKKMINEYDKRIS